MSGSMTAALMKVNFSSNMAEILVILDFDKTIIDVDSDYWVVEEFGLIDLFNQLLPTMPLNSVMTRITKELHSRGITIHQIVEVLNRIPIHPCIVHALKSAHASGCELRIISNSNTFFIDTILKHVGLRDCFYAINTNPGFVDEQGRLNILPFHDHGCCALCPANMCKGRIVERIQASEDNNKKRIVYLGDGDGDYCPSLKLTRDDFLMPRKKFPVWELICRNSVKINAEIHEWIDGEEFERVLLEIIGAVSVQGSQFLSSDDCRLLTSTVAAHEPLPNSLSVT
ncbi:inorganic pyrophosphatase 2-like [Mercurialis annua]|uniref:inorganic pyrophosphatase 2-like n=1 Tax=Mercurialis annua TaxID=3986 RepID=UPI00215FBFFC|nr:inorganic pyrophosphatase 2-like [Mercurialis annua]